MHSRNRYADKKPDFGELAEFRPSLKPFLLQKNDPSTQPHSFSLDFSKPAALRELACALLERDFGITLEIPLDKLIPTVPLRLNYIHWLEDLLSGDANPSIPKGTSIVGIDIGMMMFCSQPHPDHTQTTPRWKQGSFFKLQMKSLGLKYMPSLIPRTPFSLGMRLVHAWTGSQTPIPMHPSV